MIHRTANVYGDLDGLHESVSIGAFCDIGYPKIGEGTKIQTHVSIPRGWTIGSQVFIGPGVRFANDRRPNLNRPFIPERGAVGDGAVIGMGALILPVKIGKNAVVGAGSVVLQDIPDGETWAGNPAGPLA